MLAYFRELPAIHSNIAASLLFGSFVRRDVSWVWIIRHPAPSFPLQCTFSGFPSPPLSFLASPLATSPESEAFQPPNLAWSISCGARKECQARFRHWFLRSDAVGRSLLRRRELCRAKCPFLHWSTAHIQADRPSPFCTQSLYACICLQHCWFRCKFAKDGWFVCRGCLFGQCFETLFRCYGTQSSETAHYSSTVWYSRLLASHFQFIAYLWIPVKKTQQKLDTCKQKSGDKNSYLNVFNELDWLAILAKVFRLDVLENLHAIWVFQLGIEGVCSETSRSQRSLTWLILLVISAERVILMTRVKALSHFSRIESRMLMLHFLHGVMDSSSVGAASNELLLATILIQLAKTRLWISTVVSENVCGGAH